MEKSTGDILAQAQRKRNIEALRAIVYSGDIYGSYEREAMRLFIDSRQDWCKNAMLELLKHLK